MTKKFQVIWYNMDQEVKRDLIESAEDEKDALEKAYELYGGKDNAPAPLNTVIVLKG